MSSIDRSHSTRHRTVTASVSPGPASGIWAITFTSQAEPGTLAALAGTLTAARLDILSAVVRVTSVGTVVDSFEVAPLDGAALGPDDGHRLARLAASILHGDYDVSADLSELRRRYPPRTKVAPRVETHTDSVLTTGINVVCADRPGLLYDITSTLTRHGLRTRSIAVLTFGDRAHDAFRVVDEASSPPTDPARLSAVRADLLRACAC